MSAIIQEHTVILYFKLVKKQNQIIFTFWHFHLYQKPSLEEADTSSSGSRHNGNMDYY